MKISSALRRQIKAALLEDIGRGDITSNLLVPETAKGKAIILSRETGIFCGRLILEEIFRVIDPRLKARFYFKDGERFLKNKTILEIKGSVRSILRAERTVLNLLSHLCGVATRTRQFVEKVKKYPVFILDTRKTMPLWREAEKYAVKAGGGKNHRMGLYDAIFVKENHRPYGQLARLRQYAGKFEIEVRNLRELTEAFILRPRVILLDNFKPHLLREAVMLARKTHPEIILEASGGVTLQNVGQYAATGVDWISVGSLTHSVPAIDFSLLIE